MIDLTEDLDAFFAPTADFSQLAIWAGREIYGVYQAPSDVALGVFGTRPTFAVKFAEVKDDIARAQPVQIGDDNYRIADWNVDSMGLVATMVLERAV